MKDFLHAREDDENEALLDDDAPNSDSNIATFWDVFVEEITRVDKSFQNSLSDIFELLNDFQALVSSCNADTERDKKLKKIQETFLKRIATVLHDKIAKLEDFRLINRTAAIKILKKFDKGATKNGGQPFYDIYLARMDKLEFGHGNSLVEAKRGLVELYAACFCDGEQEEALLKLSLSKAVISQEVKQWVALKMGVVIALMAWLVNDCIVSPQMSMIYLLGMPTKVVIGTSLFQIIFTTAFTTVMHAVSSQTVDMMLALLLILGGVIGAQIGAKVGVKLRADQMRVMLALLVLAVCGRVAACAVLGAASPTRITSIRSIPLMLSTRSAKSFAASGRPQLNAQCAALARLCGFIAMACICLASSLAENASCRIMRAPPARTISRVLTAW